MATRKAPRQRPRTPPTFEVPKDFRLRSKFTDKDVTKGGGPRPPGRGKPSTKRTKPNRPRSPDNTRGERLPLGRKRVRPPTKGKA